METSDFIARHGGTTFRHSNELFAAIRSGVCVLQGFSDGGERLPGSHFLRIYKIRTDMLRDRRLNSPLAVTIIADSEALMHELEQCTEEPCGVWIFSLPPHDTFSIYEALRSRRVLGCIRAVDRRLVDNHTWEHLWYETGV